eukprot:2799866-Pleurochrysis_carterae.AAC.3
MCANGGHHIEVYAPAFTYDEPACACLVAACYESICSVCGASHEPEILEVARVEPNVIGLGREQACARLGGDAVRRDMARDIV